MGLLEEPRAVIRASCNKFFEMPEETIRARTFCCGSGSGIGTDENIEARLRGGLPRAAAVRHVRETRGVNMLSCICAIDKATLPAVMDYWVPGVQVCGVHELLGNALVMKHESRGGQLRASRSRAGRVPMRDLRIIIRSRRRAAAAACRCSTARPGQNLLRRSSSCRRARRPA